MSENCLGNIDRVGVYGCVMYVTIVTCMKEWVLVLEMVARNGEVKVVRMCGAGVLFCSTTL